MGPIRFVFEARQPTRNGLRGGCRDPEDGPKDRQDGFSCDGNRL